MTDVIVVGAGPIGLDLACRLALAGVSARVLERRTAPNPWSRSIGIHPPALEALAEIGVADRLIESAVLVRKGRAMSHNGTLAVMSCEILPPPYRFILAIPQSDTETILEARLLEVAPGALTRGVAVSDVVPHPDFVEVQTDLGDRYQARLLAGCDGMYSVVRRSLGIAFPGSPYPDAYAMGDFDESGGLDSEAAVFLTPGGLVESFPLPGGIRRWVMRTGGLLENPPARTLTDIVRDRTGFEVDPESARFTSGFRVHRYLAERLWHGRVILAGDAAHIVSPIGGQGMNLGWLDGREAARAIIESLERPDRREPLFAGYSKRRRDIARRVARRAEFNMAFGRPGFRSAVARVAARVVLSPWLRKPFAQRFTMRGL